jgi:hypothetical protein
MRKLLYTRAAFWAFMFCSCNKNDVRHTVQYFISSKGNMSVSYNDANGELIFLNNVSSAWKYSFNAPGDGRVINLIVKSVDGNSVGGSILVDAQEAALSNSNTGSVSMATRLP